MTQTATPVTERNAAFAGVLQRQGAAVVLVLGLAAAWFAFPRFGSADNLRDLALQSSFLAVIADSSMSSPRSLGSLAPSLDVASTPATAASAPEMT